MTDIPIGSPMHRAMTAQAAERQASLLEWLFSRDEAPNPQWTICGPIRSDKGRER